MDPVIIDKLHKIITNLESAVVAFSGGVDSTLLLSLSVRHLKNKQFIDAAHIAEAVHYRRLDRQE